MNAKKKQKWTVDELKARGWVQHGGSMMMLNGGDFLVAMAIGPDGVCHEEEKTDVDPFSIEDDERTKLLAQFPSRDARKKL